MRIDELEINSNESGKKKRKKMTAQEKWQIFLETGVKGAPVGEILRRNGLYSSDLTKIRKQVESAALKELGRRKYSKKPQEVPYQDYERIKSELTAKEKALAQMGEEYLLFKKERIRPFGRLIL